MVFFPPCKINLGLHVTARRPDGFHDLITCFYPVPLTDMLEILPAKQFSFQRSGIQLDEDPNADLCVKAYSLLKEEASIPPVQMYLHKIIPTGAGLGGGSSDAAWTLRGLNELFGLNIPVGKLKVLASRLGSDCAFFIDGRPAIGKGRGDILETAEPNLAGWYLVLVQPGVRIGTSDAYSRVVPQIPNLDLRETIEKFPVAEWRHRLINDFESSVFARFPEVANVKRKLDQMGAVYSSMTGSGSCVYGLFDRPANLSVEFRGMFYWEARL